jgi:hypothetical protein
VFELNDLNTNSIKEKFRFKNKKVKEIQETIGIHGMLVQNGRKLYLYIYIYIYIYTYLGNEKRYIHIQSINTNIMGIKNMSLYIMLTFYESLGRIRGGSSSG